MTKYNSFLKIANAVALAATVAVNILANALPLGGISTGQISAMYPTIFTPDGLTFAIWGVIYIMLGAFVVTQFFAKSNTDTKDIGIYFILSCIFNILWLIAWHQQLIVLATLSIAALLTTLIIIYRLTRSGSMLTRVTFSIYYAWITVATMISVFVLIKTVSGYAPVTPLEPRMISGVAEGYTDIILIGGDPVIASYVSILEYVSAILAIVITTAITILHILKFKDYAYAATILWAISGIMIKQMQAPAWPGILLTAALISMILIISIVINKLTQLLGKKKGINYEIF